MKWEIYKLQCFNQVEIIRRQLKRNHNKYLSCPTFIFNEMWRKIILKNPTVFYFDISLTIVWKMWHISRYSCVSVNRVIHSGNYSPFHNSPIVLLCMCRLESGRELWNYLCCIFFYSFYQTKKCETHQFGTINIRLIWKGKGWHTTKLWNFPT